MFNTEGYKIYISRGDSATIELVLTGDIPSQNEATVVASLKENKTTKKEIWRKELEWADDGMYLIDIRPEDTDNLNFGVYWWDARVFYHDNQGNIFDVRTPIPPSEFHVLEVVTNLPSSGGG